MSSTLLQENTAPDEAITSTARFSRCIGIERAITVGRDRLDVPYGVLSYTGDGEYEIGDSTFRKGAYVAGWVHGLETT